MAFTNWPTDNDLISYLSGMQIWDSSLTSLVSGYIDGAINRFQMLTGRIPFLAESTPSSGFYDPPGSVSKSYYYPWRGGGKVLELDTGYTEITAVYTAHSIDNPGNSMDLNRNLRFLPINYANKGVPIDEIEFFFNNWGVPGSIVVVGKRGYSSTIPGDVWNAIVQEAAANFSAAVAVLINGGSTSQAEADVKLTFPVDGDTFGAQIDRWHQAFMQTVNRFKLIRLGF